MTRLSILCLFIAVILGVKTHVDSDQSKDRPLPTSLVYVEDGDSENAYWASYDAVLSDWNAPFFYSQKEKNQNEDDFSVISSKYGTAFRHMAAVHSDSLIPLSPPKMRIDLDTVIGNQRILELCISPTRNVNRLELYTNEVELISAEVKGIPLSEYYLSNRKNGRLITHYISDNEDTELKLRWPAGTLLELKAYESGSNLLSQEALEIQPRPEDEIPMPFVLNDALLWTKTFRFEP